VLTRYKKCIQLYKYQKIEKAGGDWFVSLAADNRQPDQTHIAAINNFVYS